MVPMSAEDYWLTQWNVFKELIPLYVVIGLLALGAWLHSRME